MGMALSVTAPIGLPSSGYRHLTNDDRQYRCFPPPIKFFAQLSTSETSYNPQAHVFKVNLSTLRKQDSTVDFGYYKNKLKKGQSRTLFIYCNLINFLDDEMSFWKVWHEPEYKMWLEMMLSSWMDVWIRKTTGGTAVVRTPRRRGPAYCGPHFGLSASSVYHSSIPAGLAWPDLEKVM